MNKKVKRFLKWIEITIFMGAIILSIARASYCDGLSRSKWAMVIASVAPLKLAISECLNDNEFDAKRCQNIEQLNGYGIDALPKISNDSFQASIKLTAVAGYNAVITLIGDKEDLEGCQFGLIPVADNAIGRVTWNPVWLNSFETEGCIKFIKGSKALSEFLS